MTRVLIRVAAEDAAQTRNGSRRLEQRPKATPGQIGTRAVGETEAGRGAFGVPLLISIVDE